MGTLIERLLNKIDMTDTEGCWLWTGTTQPSGYGRLWDGARMGYSHRIVYEEFVGPIGDGMQVDHICHNRLCCNPDHLRECSNAENVRNRVNSKREGLKGANWDRTKRLWKAQIMVNYETVFLGYHSTPEAAHAAYSSAASKLHGEFACDGEIPPTKGDR